MLQYNRIQKNSFTEKKMCINSKCYLRYDPVFIFTISSFLTGEYAMLRNELLWRDEYANASLTIALADWYFNVNPS